MDQDQEQLLVLCKTHKAKALEIVVEKILSNPNIYKFAEFLDLENVQKLGEANKHLKTLKLFAYHNYSDYKGSSEFIELTEPQLKKLKMLSIVTMAGENKTLSYSTLREELDIGSKNDLEEILLESIYNKLITATLDERNQNVQIEWTFGRDYFYDPTSDNNIEIDKLSSWVKKMEKVEDRMEALISDLDNNLLESKEAKKQFVEILVSESATDDKESSIMKKVGSAASKITGMFR
ncbi:unnamed protein product [Moneuplotes crassus]|uniref:PCI domain-containing protein n=1 Tax=Euplotes crassus TaxID=5936 RepID=A0AAD1XX01_EUPCR|nr:unnamed protein product [Moneuplotes crassus]